MGGNAVIFGTNPTTNNAERVKTDGAGALVVSSSGGSVPSGSADSGSPVKVGGRYNATLPTFTDGQRGDLQIGSRGSLSVQLMGPDSTTQVSVAAANSDGATSSSAGILNRSYTYGYNGTTWDRIRGDANGLVVQSGLSSTFWNYASAAGGIVSSTADVVLKAAAGASIRNYLKTLNISHDALGAATEIVVKDGAAVLWRGKLQTTANEGLSEINFDPPLKGTANTALNVALISSVTGGVFVNATGFTGT